MKQIKISIIFFGSYAEDISRQLEEEVPEGFTLNKLKDLLVSRYPVLRRGFSSGIDRPVLSINGRVIVDLEVPLQAGDTLSVFPPVGGG